MSMINPLARARGHGSAKEGVHHWYLQRTTAVLLIFLVGWLVYAIASLAGGGYEAALTFLGHPFHATCAVLLAVAGLYHAMLGMQVVIEDYVHAPAVEITLQLLVKALGYGGMAA
ncbi:MAG: succinate dehydrogenase, hydrophobic membrane anchor protein, partial [Xanthomonadales bacterium]|nr:succinate dehydrogenase, hydrophobic membrane anchor protein [Xanthomonadales bacterium]